MTDQNHELVQECKIIIRFTYHDRIHNVFSEGMHDFLAFQDFKNYLRWEPERAMLFGYGRRDEEKLKRSNSSNVRISVLYSVGNKQDEVPLKDANDMVRFFEKHAAVAAKIGYPRKLHI